jgi:hypothetical protein
VNGNAEKLASLLNQDSCTDDEATEFTFPSEPTYANPCDRFGVNSVPMLATVLEAYANEASVVDVLENVLSAVNTLDVYVFGIVVDEWMNELVVLFRYVESRVRALPVLVSPVPSRLLND